MKLKTIDTPELAEILKVKTTSLRTKVWRVRKGLDPAHQLPPFSTSAGKPLWRLDDVKQWLDDGMMNKRNNAPAPTPEVKQRPLPEIRL